MWKKFLTSGGAVGRMGGMEWDATTRETVKLMLAVVLFLGMVWWVTT